MPAAPVISTALPLLTLALVAAWLLLRQRRPALGRVVRDLAGARDEAEAYMLAFRNN